MRRSVGVGRPWAGQPGPQGACFLERPALDQPPEGPRPRGQARGQARGREGPAERRRRDCPQGDPSVPAALDGLLLPRVLGQLWEGLVLRVREPGATRVTPERPLQGTRQGTRGEQ